METPVPTAAPNPLEDEIADVLYFWGEECHTCHGVQPFVDDQAREHPGVRFEFVEIYGNTTNATRYHVMNRVLNVTPRGVPEVVVDGQAFFGEDEIRNGLPGALRAIAAR